MRSLNVQLCADKEGYKMLKDIFELLVFAGLLAMVMIWGVILGA